MLESAFTVKHEMISSLPDTLRDFRKQDTEIYRLKDGGRIYDLGKSERPLNITEEVIGEKYE
jgi:hypothetical protein